MEISELRLELLKLVYRPDRDADLTIIVAKIYEEYATGTRILHTDETDDLDESPKASLAKQPAAPSGTRKKLIAANSDFLK